MRNNEKADAARLETIRRQIQGLDLICSGTLLGRTKACGKPNCACASDPAARHGPYYEWNRWENGALRHRTVSPEEARAIRRAQRNYQQILKLLTDREDETACTVLGPKRASRRRTRR